MRKCTVGFLALLLVVCVAGTALAHPCPPVGAPTVKPDYYIAGYYGMCDVGLRYQQVIVEDGTCYDFHEVVVSKLEHFKNFGPYKLKGRDMTICNQRGDIVFKVPKGYTVFVCCEKYKAGEMAVIAKGDAMKVKLPPVKKAPAKRIVRRCPPRPCAPKACRPHPTCCQCCDCVPIPGVQYVPAPAKRP